MDAKIIPISECETCKEVLIFLDRTEDGDIVRLIAWHYVNNEPYIQIGEMFVQDTSSDRLMMQRYIEDFSEKSAYEFANSLKELQIA